MTEKQKQSILSLFEMVERVTCGTCDRQVCNNCTFSDWVEESKQPFLLEEKETLDYYTTTCTSCGKVSPIGNYCMWCGEKGTCL